MLRWEKEVILQEPGSLLPQWVLEVKLGSPGLRQASLPTESSLPFLKRVFDTYDHEFIAHEGLSWCGVDTATSPSGR